MASFQEFLQRISQQTILRLEESSTKINQSFQSWLDDFYPNAVQQIQNLNNDDVWRPKTPKRNTRKRVSSRQNQTLSEVQSSKKLNTTKTQNLDASAGTSRKKTKAQQKLEMTKTSSSTQSETENDGNEGKVPPPEPKRSKRSGNNLPSTVNAFTKSAEDSDQNSEEVICVTKHNPKRRTKTRKIKTDSSTQSESQSEVDDDKISMPPPKRKRSKQNANQSYKKSTKPKRSAASKSNLTSSFRNSQGSKRDSEVSMRLVLDSITDEGTPVPPVNDMTFKHKPYVLLDRSLVDGYVSDCVKPNDVRQTIVIQAASPKAQDQKDEVSFKAPITVVSDNENNQQRPKRTPLVSSNNNGNNLKMTNNESVIHTTPRLPVLNDAKRSLHNILGTKTPNSPKQLFSPYTRGDIRAKTEAFEKAHAANSPCTTKPRRSSVCRKSQALSTLTLAQAARMSISSRRSSIMRHRLNVVYKQCNRTRLSDKENESDSMQECKESEEDDITVKSTGTEVPSTVSPQRLSKKLETKTRKKSSIKSLDLTKKPNSSSENVLGDHLEESSSSTTSYHSPEKVKLASVHDVSKVISSAPSFKRPYPASETRVPNKVAALVSQFDKQCASSSRAQGHMKKKISGSTALTNSNFKQFQKANSVSKTSREVLLEMRRAKEEEAYRKRIQLLKEKTEESKRKNDEKQQKVKEKRLKEMQASENLRRTLERQEQHQIAAKKSVLEKKKSLIEAKKTLRLKREQELERRRKEEAEQRMIRQKRLEELRQQELAELKKQQEKRENEARNASAAAKVKQMPNLNQTYTAEKSSPDGGSYDITPHRSELPKEDLKDINNYDIGDLKSGDETDDENDPKKVIPNWAQGVSLRIAIINQHRNPPDMEKLFPPIETCHLEKIFKIQRSRFQVRTSSAVWHVPPFPTL